jgi:hypothetical protein
MSSSISRNSELNLQQKFLKALRLTDNCKVIKTVGGPYQERGVSDLLLCWHGRYVAIELKEPGRFEDGYCLAERFKPTSPTETAQQQFLLQVLAAGGHGFFCSDLAVGLARLHRLMAMQNNS